MGSIRNFQTVSLGGSVNKGENVGGHGQEVVRDMWAERKAPQR
jgi:hypothetical protein